MRDLHDAFGAWLDAGGRDDPPRDVALHAAGCETCRAHAAAFDALGTIDLDEAAAPPLRAAPLHRNSVSGALRAAAAAVAVIAVIGAGTIVGGNALRGRAPEASIAIAVPEASPAPAGGVLGAAAGPTESVDESASPTTRPSPSTTATPRAVAQTDATPLPTMGGGPPPVVGQPPLPPPPPPTGTAATPQPQATPGPASSAPTPTPAIPTPIPSTPTPTPTPTPTEPPPTPLPTLPECADLADNDGDGAVDLADPDCLDLDDLSESS